MLPQIKKWHNRIYTTEKHTTPFAATQSMNTQRMPKWRVCFCQETKTHSLSVFIRYSIAWQNDSTTHPLKTQQNTVEQSYFFPVQQTLRFPEQCAFDFLSVQNRGSAHRFPSKKLAKNLASKQAGKSSEAISKSPFFRTFHHRKSPEIRRFRGFVVREGGLEPPRPK